VRRALVAQSSGGGAVVVVLVVAVVGDVDVLRVRRASAARRARGREDDVVKVQVVGASSTSGARRQQRPAAAASAAASGDGRGRQRQVRRRQRRRLAAPVTVSGAAARARRRARAPAAAAPARDGDGRGGAPARLAAAAVVVVVAVADAAGDADAAGAPSALVVVERGQRRGGRRRRSSSSSRSSGSRRSGRRPLARVGIERHGAGRERTRSRRRRTVSLSLCATRAQKDPTTRALRSMRGQEAQESGAAERAGPGHRARARAGAHRGAARISGGIFFEESGGARAQGIRCAPPRRRKPGVREGKEGRLRRMGRQQQREGMGGARADDDDGGGKVAPRSSRRSPAGARAGSLADFRRPAVALVLFLCAPPRQRRLASPFARIHRRYVSLERPTFRGIGIMRARAREETLARFLSLPSLGLPVRAPRGQRHAVRPPARQPDGRCARVSCPWRPIGPASGAPLGVCRGRASEHGKGHSRSS
jgi:hypothetical protein